MQQKVLHIGQVVWSAFLGAVLLWLPLHSIVDITKFTLGEWHLSEDAANSVLFLISWLAMTLACAMCRWMFLTDHRAPDVIRHAQASERWSKVLGS